MKLSMLATCLAIAAGSALAWTTLQPRVEAGGAEYWIEAATLVYNGTDTHIRAQFVGICENGTVWIMQRLAYSSKPWRWGKVERGNFTEDPLMNSRPTINWRASPIPEC